MSSLECIKIDGIEKKSTTSIAMENLSTFYNKRRDENSCNIKVITLVFLYILYFPLYLLKKMVETNQTINFVVDYNILQKYKNQMSEFDKS